MAIKEYSCTRDGEKFLGPNFRVREFACRDGSDPVMIDAELVVLLQCIREHFGKPLHITSGYRTASYNARPDVNGSKSSQHLLGRAADFWVEEVPIAEVADYAEKLLPDRGGIKKPLTGWTKIQKRASRWLRDNRLSLPFSLASAGPKAILGYREKGVKAVDVLRLPGQPQPLLQSAPRNTFFKASLSICFHWTTTKRFALIRIIKHDTLRLTEINRKMEVSHGVRFQKRVQEILSAQE